MHPYAEIRNDIERFLGGERVLAYRETVLERLVRLILHNQALVLLVAAYLVIRIALFFFMRRKGTPEKRVIEGCGSGNGHARRRK